MNNNASTRAAIFGVFVVAGRPLTAAQIVALARPLKLSATNVKSHLSRMVAEGVLLRSGPVRLAQYRPSPPQTVVVGGIQARLQLRSMPPWKGDWLMLSLRMPTLRSSRDQLKAALWFDGFRSWTGNTWLRPAWPLPWALERARLLLDYASGICMQGKLLTAIDVAQIAEAYQLNELDREARQLADSIQQRRIPDDSAKAFAQRLRTGGMVARFMGHDPRLPSELWGKRTGMRDLVKAFHHFERKTAPVAQRFIDEILKQ